jgi:hypothetical protein
MKISGKLLIGAVGLALLVGGCAKTYQVQGDVEKTGFLVDAYPLLKPGKEGEANLVYLNPEARWKTYDKIMLDPVTVWLGKDAVAKDTGVVPPDDVRALANLAYQKVSEQLAKDYTLVQESGPDVMRLSTALTDVEHGMPFLDAVSTIHPVTHIVSEGKKLASGTHSFVGGASVEVKLVDSQTGKLLGAGIDRRAGGKTLTKGFGYWADVENILDYWAAKLRWRLCKQRGGTDCQSPD